jgi:threonine dehydrogenase-like Zn-dependent dehydrogenase
VDVAIQTTPIPKLTEEALESVGKGGRVLVVGWNARSTYHNFKSMCGIFPATSLKYLIVNKI